MQNTEKQKGLPLWMKHEIWNLHSKGKSGREIAKELFCSKSAVNNLIKKLKQQGIKPNGARVTFIDVETAPAIVAAFNRYDVNLTQKHILKEGGWLISIAWADSSGKVESLVLNPDEAIRADDFRIACKLQRVIDNTDILVGHNIKKFDWKVIKTCLLRNGLVLTHQPKIVDTLEIARRNFKFASNKLGDLGVILGIDTVKGDPGGIETWIACTEGNSKALTKMKVYNEGDVELLRKVYNKIIAWSNQLPNQNLYSKYGIQGCTNCGSSEVYPTSNKVSTPSKLHVEHMCASCGHLMRETPSGKLVNIV